MASSTLILAASMDTTATQQTGNGKVALVTGASGGIGKTVAERLAKDGFAVVAGYSGKSASTDELVAAIEATGGKAVAVKADVADAGEVAKLFEQATAQYRRLDVVVHCAGIMPLSPIEKGDVETFDKVIATNLRGTFLIFCEAAKHIADGGRIIAFSSSVVAKAFPTYGAYVASKAGVEGLVHVLANELGKRQVTVNAVAPGPVNTPLFTKDKSQEEMDKIAAMAPLGRIGEPEDISGVVSFLAGPDGKWINAQTLRANGGFA